MAESKKPAVKLVSLNSGAQTRTKTPGAFLHDALALTPPGRVSGMRPVIERSSMESPDGRKQKTR